MVTQEEQAQLDQYRGQIKEDTRDSVIDVLRAPEFDPRRIQIPSRVVGYEGQTFPITEFVSGIDQKVQFVSDKADTLIEANRQLTADVAAIKADVALIKAAVAKFVEVK